MMTPTTPQSFPCQIRPRQCERRLFCPLWATFHLLGLNLDGPPWPKTAYFQEPQSFRKEGCCPPPPPLCAFLAASSWPLCETGGWSDPADFVLPTRREDGSQPRSNRDGMLDDHPFEPAGLLRCPHNPICHSLCGPFPFRSPLHLAHDVTIWRHLQM